ncbi:MAG: GtrA family protein [Dermatophilaceae bacterium]
MSLRPTPTVPASSAHRRPGWLLHAVKDQRLAFVIVGTVNTAIGFVAFFGFDDLFGSVVPDWKGVPHNTAVLACAHIVTVLCAFGLYRRLVFRVQGLIWRDLYRFESVYLTSVAVNWVLLNLLVELGQLTPKLAQTVIVLVTGVFSWFGHKYFSFRRPQEQIHR